MKFRYVETPRTSTFPCSSTSHLQREASPKLLAACPELLNGSERADFCDRFHAKSGQMNPGGINAQVAAPCCRREP
jgi:hypothetical protein